MATYKVRGNSHNIIYSYRTAEGESKQQWETYATELEALQRKTYIDYLQKNKLFFEVMKAALDYRRQKAVERAVSDQFKASMSQCEAGKPEGEDNTHKTYREFVEKWLPFHARKNRFSPNSYDSYRHNLDLHILPYFGDQVMSTITAEDIDNFLDYLSKKPCKGPKSYGKRSAEIPTLSSSSVKKCFTVLCSGFHTAKKWHYINEIPDVTAPSEKTVKRKAWDATRIREVLDSITDDPILHLAVHLSFVCSLRAGETAGIDLSTISFTDGSMWITRQVQRVSDKALTELPQGEIIRVFPKQVPTSKSSMILKGPKTDGSRRKQYLTQPLLQEIRERLNEIQEQKDFLGDEYHDYGLLICQPDGRPIDPKSFDLAFKAHQTRLGIAPEAQIEFQGLRKSGQMHKVRLSQNNYQLVAESGGQSPEVLMSNYNEALDSEKRALSRMVESSFYPEYERREKPPEEDPAASMLEKIKENPDLGRQLLQSLLLGAAVKQQGTQDKSF